ncbi:MAG: sulfotransferase [Pseudomonadota bacterium]|nr:sulfotransferase [Pseudomonadota bacterium]
MTRQKVFCVGLGKTGTTSLKESLRILGYRTIRLPLDWKDITDFDAALPGVSAALYEDLDAAFPGSKFILTLRDVEGWLKSIERDMGRKVGVQRERSEDRETLLKLKYGTAVFDKDKFRKGFHDHEAQVKKYFENRPDDLLVLNITTSAGWEPLCSFLGLPVPELPFPFANKATEQDELLLRLLHVTRDVEAVASISKYSREYVEQLSQAHDVEHYDLKSPLVLKDDRRINKIIKRTCAYFGVLPEPRRN